jgi:hypothetical protein
METAPPGGHPKASVSDDYIKKVFGIAESACLLDYYVDADDKHRLFQAAPSFPEYITQGDLSHKGPDFLVEAVTMGTRGLQYLFRALRTFPTHRNALDDMVKGIRLVAAGLTKAQEERLRSGLGLSDHELKDLSEENKFPRSVRTALAASYFRGGPGDSAFPGRPVQPQPVADAALAQSAARPFYPFPYAAPPYAPPYYFPYAPYGAPGYPQAPPSIPRPPSPSTVTPTPAPAPQQPGRPATPPVKDDAPPSSAPEPAKEPQKPVHQHQPDHKSGGKRGGGK